MCRSSHAAAVINDLNGIVVGGYEMPDSWLFNNDTWTEVSNTLIILLYKVHELRGHLQNK